MVYIVMKNGRVDEVFSSKEMAEHHKKQLISKWNLVEIIEKQVKDI